jgi:PiT family inorganic phosphate transporter
MGLGVFTGGRLFVRSLAMKYFRLDAPQGLGAEFAAAGTMFGCAAAGFPASATQVISGSIVGAAAAQSARGVR